MEPGFYRCKKCGRSWERTEFKLRRNPPRECPHCRAGHEDQAVDEERERAYVSEVYGPAAQAVAGIV